MATVTAAAATSTFALPKRLTGTTVIGLPHIGTRGGRVRCSLEAKPSAAAVASKATSVLTAASAMTAASPVLALVDERMSTEGTGLSLGISNNLLTWILLGVFGLIWALYFAYTSTLEEDEDSALSL